MPKAKAHSHDRGDDSVKVKSLSSLSMKILSILSIVDKVSPRIIMTPQGGVLVCLRTRSEGVVVSHARMGNASSSRKISAQDRSCFEARTALQ